MSGQGRPALPPTTSTSVPVQTATAAQRADSGPAGTVRQADGSTIPSPDGPGPVAGAQDADIKAIAAVPTRTDRRRVMAGWTGFSGRPFRPAGLAEKFLPGDCR